MVHCLTLSWSALKPSALPYNLIYDVFDWLPSWLQGKDCLCTVACAKCRIISLLAFNSHVKIYELLSPVIDFIVRLNSPTSICFKVQRML